MNRYRVDTHSGKKTYYTINNVLTGKQLAQTFGDFMAANQIIMCLNMYEELKDIGKLSEVLKMLDDAGR